MLLILQDDMRAVLRVRVCVCLFLYIYIYICVNISGALNHLSILVDAPEPTDVLWPAWLTSCE